MGEANKRIVFFKDEDLWNNILDKLNSNNYKWINNIAPERIKLLFERGNFLCIDYDTKMISYYGNFYKLPRFKAEDLLEQSISDKDYITCIS